MAIGRIALCSVKGIITIREIEVEVTGNGYIDLTDAVANKLLELKAYGGCEQDLTPTPTTPVDIKCNNGTLKVKDKELPVGYVRIESIEFDGSMYYDTEEHLFGADSVKMKLSNTGGSGRNVFGCYTTTSATDNFSLYVYTTNSSQAYFRYGDDLYRPIFGTGTRTITFGSGGTTGFYSGNVTAQEQTFETSANAYIGALPNSSSAKLTGTIYGNIEVSSGGTTRLKWIPCKRKSDGVIGYYEVVNGNFLEPSGSGTPTAGAEDYSNIEVYVQGTKEKVGYSGGATATCEDLLGVGTYLDEQEILSGNVITKVGVAVLTGDESWTVSSSGVIYSDVLLDKNTDAGYELCTQYSYDSSAMESMADNTFKVGGSTYRTRLYIKDSVNGTSSANYNSYCKAQLSAGTPVIIVYPLETPTTLSVAGQSLSIPAGDSTIEIVEGSILNLPLYAKYKANE